MTEPLPFDFRRFVHPGPSEAHPRLSALLMLMAIRDGADLVVIETDPTPNVVAARIGYRCGITWYELVPCPHAEVRHVFPALLPYLRLCHPLRSIWRSSPTRVGTLSLVLDQSYGEIVVTDRVQGSHQSVTFQLPVLPEVQARAGAALESTGDSLLIEFDHTPEVPS